MVVFCHCALVTNCEPGGSRIGRKIEQIFLQVGHPAVVLFFVLSGFVLSLQFLPPAAQPNYAAFLTKRFFRIYPALIVALVAAAIMFICIGSVSNSAIPWSSVIWSEPISVEVLARHLLLLVMKPSDINLDGAIWSMAYEVRICFVLPIIAALVRRSVVFTIASLAIMFFIEFAFIKEGMPYPPIFGASFFGAVLITAYYAGCFFVGSEGAKRYVRGQVPKLRPWIDLCLAGAAITVMILVNHDAIIALAALTLIIVALHGPIASRLLNVQPLRWLGRISYSLYLIHGPITYAAIKGFGVVPTSAICFFIVGASLIAAHFMYEMIERPGIQLGHWLASGFRLGRLAPDRV